MKNLNFVIVSVSGLVWHDLEHTTIEADVTFEHIGAPTPFASDANYDYQHGIDFYNNALAGEYGVIGDYEPEPELPIETQRAMASPLTALEIRQKLTEKGIDRDTIYEMFDNMDKGTEKNRLLDLWEYSTEFNRTNEDVITFGAALGLTEADLDEIWGIK